jgi:Omp85 superfamily domain
VDKVGGGEISGWCRRSAFRGVLTLALAGVASGGARAADNEHTAHAPAAELARPPLERAVVPLVGGDTDVGIGLGALGSLARLAPNGEDFRWKLEGAAFVTAKGMENGVASPWQDVFLMLTMKDLWAGRLRLELRAAYTRESNLRYYGLGNASVAPREDQPERDFFVRTHPAARAQARVRLLGPLHVQVGTMYIHNWLGFDPSSRVLADASSGPVPVRAMLPLDTEHGLHLVEAGLVYDSRDDEIAPSRGQHHQMRVRVSPWQTANLPYRYGGASLSLSGFVPLGDRVVFAARAVGDVQMGNVPFYELSRFDETSAIGGPKYIRGVPSNRYYGKRKLLSNLETRVRVAEFTVGKSQYELGTTAFFDAGRVWADLGPDPALDGTGFGIKYGTGAGLRLQKGKTFVLRVDLAWSPDARPLGGYFLAEHIF